MSLLAGFDAYQPRFNVEILDEPIEKPHGDNQ
jgi:hypothetical protein